MCENVGARRRRALCKEIYDRIVELLDSLTDEVGED